MSPNHRFPWMHHLLWGLGLGTVAMFGLQVLTWLGLGLSHVTWILTYLLVVAFAYLATSSYRNRMGARPGFFKATLLLLVMILVSRTIYQSYMFVYINYIDPGWVDRVAELWSAQLADAQFILGLVVAVVGVVQPWKKGEISF